MFDKSLMKAAAFDLDGTLLDEGYMSDEVKRALKDLKDSGIHTIVATGRDWCQVTPEWRELFSYCVSTSGGCIRKCDTGEVLASHPLAYDDTIELIKVLDSFHSGYFLYQEGQAECTGNAFVLINKNRPRINRENFLAKFFTREHPEHSLLDYETKTAGKVFKIESYYTSKRISLDAADKIREMGKFEIVVMKHDSVEINPKGISKAGGLLELGKLIGYKAENLVAFGDSSNDYDMLETAGYAVVMSNGEDCVKEIADMIAPDVTKDGAATAIRKLFEL